MELFSGSTVVVVVFFVMCSSKTGTRYKKDALADSARLRGETKRLAGQASSESSRLLHFIFREMHTL